MSFLKSTIGRKYLVGLAGIGLSLFVLTHMAGNLLLFVSGEAYNKYAHALTSSKFIYIAEAGLIGIFLIHLVVALALTLYNRSAKGSRYAVSAKKSKASFSSRTMWFQGLVILGFVVWHLLTFKFGAHYSVVYDGVEMRDIHRLVLEVFQSPLYVLGYTAVVLLLGMHLAHGFASSFQTLGLNGEKFDAKIKCAGKVYAFLVTAGFVAQPVYVFLVA